MTTTSIATRTDLSVFEGTHWKDSLTVLGVPAEFVFATNKPCPFCNGHDRYSFTNAFGKGDSYCRHCGYHSGFDLLMHCCGLTFRESLQKLADHLGITLPERNKPPVARKFANSMQITKYWSEASPLKSGDMAWNYLLARGLNPNQNFKCMRFHPNLPYFVRDGEEKKQDNYPALLSEIHTPEGVRVGLMRTYLSESGKAKVRSPKKIFGREISGACVRLFDIGPQDDTLGIAEGIETSIAAAELFKVPVWSVLFAGNLSKFKAPEKIRKIIIFGDNDANFVGQREAYSAAANLRNSNPSLEVEVRIPEKVSTDWLDVLNDRKKV